MCTYIDGGHLDVSTHSFLNKKMFHKNPVSRAHRCSMTEIQYVGNTLPQKFQEKCFSVGII